MKKQTKSPIEAYGFPPREIKDFDIYQVWNSGFDNGYQKAKEDFERMFNLLDSSTDCLKVQNVRCEDEYELGHTEGWNDCLEEINDYFIKFKQQLKELNAEEKEK